MTQHGGAEEDYFSHFEDFELTEEDITRIDRICEGELDLVPGPVPPLPECKGQALVSIEVEQEPRPVQEAVSSPTPSSRNPMIKPPYNAFRNGKALSVSDLIGPLWCAHATWSCYFSFVNS